MKVILMLGILAVPLMAHATDYMLDVNPNSTAIICPKNCAPYEGKCACDAPAETAPPIAPSDEKPPKSGMPSYQNEMVHAAMPESLIYQDAKQDQAKRDADHEGKVAAGIQ